MSQCHETSPQPTCHAPAESACHTAATAEASHCCPPEQKVDWLLWGSGIGVVIAYLVALGMPEHSHVGFIGEFTGAVREFLNRMWWGLALGVIFVGLLSRIPRDLVMALLGRHGGLAGMFRATMAGVLLDLCSHGILAVGMKLYERGATAGQVMAFLLASPWNSLSLTLILFGLIGIGWTLTFILLSLLVGIVTGLVFDRLVGQGTLPDNPWRKSLSEQALPIGEQWHEFRSSWNFSLAGLVAMARDGLSGSRIVIRWALFGLLLAALVRAAVPTESYNTWFGPSMLGLFLTLLAATVIEVCSEGTTPIAADLMNRAQAPGNSFTFLMAGVATDYTEIMSIKETMQSWKLALFLPLVSLPQVILLGLLLNLAGPG
jgi:uncharacterized membrane protein YraQ (UPF0718 family)